ncbi:MAG: type II toxin-antitoxin system RelE/ParE family toxin [Bacteroidales bacterium]|nr:type II toxin-antitoxin system RelE/ParE family toxin [Bacteroidales bacterium]MCF8338196.1 type II toxin-antitoxin system RelE/ParE family toxin [Bacteroidales bacterium]
MEKIRTIVAYKHYFEDFLSRQDEKVQNKIYKILELVEYEQQIPPRYLKHIKGTKGLYETRFSLGKRIWRVFCFFDKGRLVILLNGFQKKSQKTPKKEIELALRLKKEYFDQKKGKK